MNDSATASTGFGPLLRRWRRFRRLSQLDLSLSANISQRHLSWLETGRSRPSRGMVIQLAEALEVPLRERNQLLDAAGFAAIYHERGLDDADMDAVRDALGRMLDNQMPYPGIVVDREWNVVMRNGCGEALMAAVGAALPPEAVGPDGRPNLAWMTAHPQGLRRLIVNWDAAAHSLIQRLREDLRRTRDPALRERLSALMDMAGDDEAGVREPAAPLMPMLSLDLRLGDQTLRLFSVIATFGTPQDITTDELRIESFFPADDASDYLLRALASSAPG